MNAFSLKKLNMIEPVAREFGLAYQREVSVAGCVLFCDCGCCHDSPGIRSNKKPAAAEKLLRGVWEGSVNLVVAYPIVRRGAQQHAQQATDMEQHKAIESTIRVSSCEVNHQRRTRGELRCLFSGDQRTNPHAAPSADPPSLPAAPAPGSPQRTRTQSTPLPPYTWPCLGR